ncbi:Dolichyl-phosphate-mannose-protein mannosyltransferase 1 [Smittium culicis]|uniref:Dolichyl-phosphate-mannose--protein mannosyltransferase n=1 Tax=Smittium culicis TaxID=133412 RepID=A0A1R1Y419_9FUNG|nr:Dolichyl-phosphate-mannose-protein mannosyltransferase 1 [Smittium culicis]
MASEKIRFRKQQVVFSDSPAIHSSSPQSNDYPYAGSSNSYDKGRYSHDYSYDKPSARISDSISGKRFRFTKKRLLVLGVLILISAYFRLWNLSNPNKVVFDEVHFGKHAGLYINGTYFLDVHPPLAKMMFAAMGKVSGYDGVYDFKAIGLDYSAANVPYVAMRFLPAFLGLAVVPITYVTIAAFGGSEDASLLGALLVSFENSFMTISRFILLDSILIFFTSITVMFWALFLRENDSPFSLKWWVYLILTGINMGNALSSKWVGLFLVATIGIWTVKDLWERITDSRVSLKTFSMHFWSRFLGLIVIPISVYIFWFYIHYAILTKSGPGNSFMSPEFQITIGNTEIQSTNRDIYYGSKIRVIHDSSSAGFLHSHSSKYESGSKQQQVTLYGHRDNNNYWVIERTLKFLKKNQNNTAIPSLEKIKDGDEVRLRHVNTKRLLHSHDVRAPVTNKDYVNEVSGYGADNFPGDDNDDWIVRIMSGDSSVPGSDKNLMSIHTRFRLIHKNQRCALFSNRVKLPKWAFEQVEVVCMKHAKYPKSLWRVESASHTLVPDDKAIKASYKVPGFFSKLIESHKVMLRVNNGLVSSHYYDSRPLSWLYLRRGIGYWSENPVSVYLFGNPIIWWLSFASIVTFVLVQFVFVLRDKRGYGDQLLGVRTQYFNSVGFFFVGWSLHFFPFFLMKRQLFLHHYLPGLWFAIIALASTVDLFTRKIGSKFRTVIICCLVFYSIHMYFVYSPLGYGSSWTKQSCEKSKIFKSWDFSCHLYPDDKYTIAKKKKSEANKSRPKNNNDDVDDLNELEHNMENAIPEPKPIDNLEEELKLNEPAPELNEQDKLKIQSDFDKFKNEYSDAKVSSSPTPAKAEAPKSE